MIPQSVRENFITHKVPSAFYLSLLLLFASALILGCEKKTEAPPKGETAGIVFKNLDGGTVSLSDYRGKVVLIEFWATWCPPCRFVIPDLKMLEGKYADSDFKLFAVSVDDSPETLREFIKDEDIKYTVLVDSMNMNYAFRVSNIPTTVLIDKDGNVAMKHMGYMSGFGDFLIEEIEKLL